MRPQIPDVTIAPTLRRPCLLGFGRVTDAFDIDLPTFTEDLPSREETRFLSALIREMDNTATRCREPSGAWSTTCPTRLVERRMMVSCASLTRTGSPNVDREKPDERDR
jgi:hypothetical protein